ncbi:hypothetical protein HNY73_009099 [Argiope bruennichi]|uniref:Uncharacterized protein n=1 Tax=Argiope bruennichi TaxID=94029 RepID=A0A8T0FAX3_ARGBR|nr:hypothetical protein HNY73_009099 [Argiope bruennichi]
MGGRIRRLGHGGGRGFQGVGSSAMRASMKMRSFSCLLLAFLLSLMVFRMLGNSIRSSLISFRSLRWFFQSVKSFNSSIKWGWGGCGLLFIDLWEVTSWLLGRGERGGGLFPPLGDPACRERIFGECGFPKENGKIAEKFPSHSGNRIKTKAKKTSPTKLPEVKRKSLKGFTEEDMDEFSDSDEIYVNKNGSEIWIKAEEKYSELHHIP